MPLAKDVKLDELAAITHGYTGADIAALVKGGGDGRAAGTYCPR